MIFVIESNDNYQPFIRPGQKAFPGEKLSRIFQRLCDPVLAIVLLLEDENHSSLQSFFDTRP